MPGIGHHGRAAIRHVRAVAVPGPPLDDQARIALHFHPDADGCARPALLHMLADGGYFSQWVTGTSNGGLTGTAHGERWEWERRIFGGAYDEAGARERPVYGALTIDQDPYGPAPRFGSAYFRLRASCLSRATFAFPDSVFHPVAFGLAEQMGLRGVMDEHRMDDPLDRYIEAHVHGGVDVPQDVEALVLDPCWAGSALEDAARSAGLAVERHAGYVLDVEDMTMHARYRGEEAVALARRLSIAGRLAPDILGRARGKEDIDPQVLKQVWHCLAAFGRTVGEST